MIVMLLARSVSFRELPKADIIWKSGVMARSEVTPAFHISVVSVVPRFPPKIRTLKPSLSRVQVPAWRQGRQSSWHVNLYHHFTSNIFPQSLSSMERAEWP